MNLSMDSVGGSVLLELQELEASRQVRGEKSQYQKPYVNIYRTQIKIIRPEDETDSK